MDMNKPEYNPNIFLKHNITVEEEKGAAEQQNWIKHVELKALQMRH